MRKGIFGASALLAVVLTAVPTYTAPAQARCVAADVIVHRTNQSDVPVVTDGQCLVPTPWSSHIRWNKDVHMPTVTGVPSGAFVEVWVPMP